jgi:DNA mismatch endonuclease Vsr
MEIMAVMKALEALREHCQVYLYSDSQYVVRQGNGSNAKELPGSPDIAFPSAHLAVFVHGCFWHRCPYCNPHFPESNVEYWSAKFERNRRRDRDNRSMFRTMAWKVLTVWECQLRNSPGRVVARIIRQPEQVQIDMRQ